MEHGDLATSVRPRTVVVLEGVLATVTPIERARRMRRSEITGHNIHWYDLALKRCVTNKRRWPDYALDVVTFLDQQVCDDAADFLLRINFPLDHIAFEPFAAFVATLPYQGDVQAVFDSDPQRLDRYGQLGKAVTRGEDF